MSLVSYLAQLDAKAAECGVDLREACRLEGVAETTLDRWRKGIVHCRWGTAQNLFSRIEKMRRERRKAGRAA